MLTISSSIGDGADAFLGLIVLASCEQIDGGLPASLRSKMMANIVIDFVIGLVPFLGDLADAVYKCNTRNAVLLEKYLREKGASSLGEQGGQTGQVIDMSLGEEFDREEEHGVIGTSSSGNGQGGHNGTGNYSGNPYSSEIPMQPQSHNPKR